MPETSARLLLPLIQGGQAQKHITHNEALAALDLLVHLVVQGFGTETPPGSPSEAQVWALGAAPTGAWAGQANALAAWSNGGWRFFAPAPGWRAALGTDLRVWSGTAWVKPDLPDLTNLPGVGVNTGWDATNKLAVASDATLLTHAGAGHQVKVNKAAAAQTATLLFQTGFSGRAEFGTAGSDDLSLKVSPDGATWATALTVPAASGLVSIPNGLTVAGALTLPAAAVVRGALANAAGLSVLGHADDVAGPVADIAAASDHQVLRRAGTTLGFGAVALNQGAAVTGTLPLTNGGTGATTAANARTTLGLGTAATAAVTTSSTDTTANRVLRVGDFGLGAPIALTGTTALQDRNLRSGLYSYGTLGVPGGPESEDRLHALYVNNLAVGGRTGYLSLRTGGAGGDVRLWVGQQTAPSTAITWHRVFIQPSILGTVSQSAGVPTGALIERGSNANGAFVRWADGTQRCVHTLAAGSGAGVTWTFPAAFAVAPTVTGTAIATVLSSVTLDAAPTAIAATFSARDSANARRADTVHLVAHGRWL